MDTPEVVGTTASIVEALGGKVEERVWPYGYEHAGVICRIAPTSTDGLADQLAAVFRIDRLEIEGARRDRIERAAIVAGVGDHPGAMRDAEARGADAWNHRRVARADRGRARPGASTPR